MTISRIRHVRTKNGRLYTLAFNSASEAYVTTYTQMTEEGYRISEPTKISVNGIDYALTAWIHRSEQTNRWHVNDLYMRRVDKDGQWDHKKPTDAARSSVWSDLREIMETHVVDNEEMQEAGYQHDIAKQIDKAQEEIGHLQEELDSKVKALEHSRNKLVSS